MTPEQFQLFIDALLKIANHKQAITELSDWPLLAALVSLFGAVFMGMVGGMWLDLRGGYKEHKEENVRQIEILWKAMKDCQADCCPPRRRASDVEKG
jgi:hypothetical protein